MTLIVTLVAGVFALLVILMIIGAAMARRRERQRIETLGAWAAANGWTITQAPDVDWWSRLPGRNRRGLGLVFSGTSNGRPISVGEYRYTDTSVQSGTDASGNSTTTTTSNTHHYVVAVARLTRPLPGAAVEHRGALSRLGRAIAGPGDTATGHPDFDKAFRIRTTEPAAIATWCSPALLDAHLRGAIPPWSVAGYELLTHRRGLLATPSVITATAAESTYLAELLDPTR